MSSSLPRSHRGAAASAVVSLLLLFGNLGCSGDISRGGCPSGFWETSQDLSDGGDGPLPGPNELANVAAISACAAFCLNATAGDCETFEYNGLLSRCTLKRRGSYEALAEPQGADWISCVDAGTLIPRLGGQLFHSTCELASWIISCAPPSSSSSSGGVGTQETHIAVLHAAYGRTSAGLCAGLRDNVTDCTEDVVEAVRAQCDGRVDCRLSVENVAMGGDPCSGVRKYLNASFVCLPGPPFAVTTGVPERTLTADAAASASSDSSGLWIGVTAVVVAACVGVAVTIIVVLRRQGSHGDDAPELQPVDSPEYGDMPYGLSPEPTSVSQTEYSGLPIIAGQSTYGEVAIPADARKADATEYSGLPSPEGPDEYSCLPVTAAEGTDEYSGLPVSAAEGIDEYSGLPVSAAEGTDEYSGLPVSAAEGTDDGYSGLSIAPPADTGEYSGLPVSVGDG